MEIDENDRSAEELIALREVLVLMTGSSNNRYINLEEGTVHEEDVKKWFHELNEEVNMTTTSLDYKVKGQMFAVPELLKLLHQCILSHQWPQASRLLQALAYEPKGTSEIIWKVGMEVLYSNPGENDGFISQLFRQLKQLRELHVDDLVLQYVMYLLCQGKLTEAAAISKQKEARKAGAEKTVNLPDHPQYVYQAYRGLVWYVEWLLLRHNTQGEQRLTDETWQTSSQADYHAMEVVRHAKQAISLMEGLCDEVGIWDIFILKLVQLKEEYESAESARHVLERYRTKNPDNPNSHRYLYHFYVSHGYSEEDRISVLQDLVDRDPSNLLVLDLCSLLRDEPVVGRYFFELLDYCNMRDQVEPWKRFRKYLYNIHIKKMADNLKVVRECWEERAAWWPLYHFLCESVNSGEITSALLVEKACCSIFLVRKGNAYTKSCMKVMKEKHRSRLARILDVVNET